MEGEPFAPDEPKPTLSARANIRLTSRELAELREAARTSTPSLSLSDYIRKRALGRQIVAASDMAVLRELRGIGALLKHIDAAIDGVHAEETAEAIRSVRRFIDGMAPP